MGYNALERYNNNSSYNASDRYKRNTAFEKIKEIQQRLEKLDKTSSTLTDTYKSRFYDENGKVKTSYRGDTDTALSSFNASMGEADKEINSILSDLSYYDGYIDPSTVSSIRTYLDSQRNAMSQMQKGYQTDFDLFSQFPTEFDYNNAILNPKPEDVKNDPFSVSRRQEIYNSNIARLKQIEKEMKAEEENFSYVTYTNGPIPTTHINGDTTKYDKLKAEKEKLEASVQRYVDTYFESDYHLNSYLGSEDWEEKTQNRDFYIPSEDDIIQYRDENDKDVFDKNLSGNYDPVAHEQASKEAEGGVNPRETVADPLGLYFKAKEEGRRPIDAPTNVGLAFVAEYNNAIVNGQNSNWEMLKDEEIDLYYYMLNSGLKDEALAYLDGMTVELQHRKTLEMQEGIENASGLELVFHNAVSVPANIIGGAAAFVGDAINTITGNRINPYDRFHTMQNYAQSVRGEISERIDEATNNINLWGFSLGDAYQGLMSGVDSAVGAVALGGAYPVIMGMGAASSTAKDLYEKGASNFQIAAGGILSGAAEMLFEKISIGYFLDNFVNSPTKGFKNWALKTLAQSGIEASEEGMTEIANILSDALIMGSESEWEQMLEQYKRDGLSDSEAIGKALGEMGLKVWEASAGGFISGGGMGAVGATVNYAQYGKYVAGEGESVISNDNLNKLVAQANNLPNTKLGNRAKNLASTFEGIDVSKLSDKQKATLSKNAGKLYEAVLEAQAEGLRNNKADVTKEYIAAKLKANGITDETDIAKGSAAIYKVVAKGERLSNAESKAIEKVNGLEIVNEILNDSRDVSVNIQEQFRAKATSMAETEALTQSSKEAKTINTDDLVLSEDGKTRIIDTEEEVSITNIASIKGEKVVVNLSNGKTADIENISFGNEDEAIIYSTIADLGIDGGSANELIRTFKSFKGNAKEFVLGLHEAVRYGGIGGKAFLNSGTFSSKLNEGQREYAYRLGKKKAEKDIENRKKQMNKKDSLKNKSSFGSASFEGVDRNSLNARQKVTVNALEAAFGSMGINVVFFESPTDAEGRHIGENGSYNKKTNTIRLDISAGIKGQDAILFTAAHELTHFIKEWSPDKFKVFSDFLVDNYAKRGVSIDVLVNQKIEHSKNSSTYEKPLTYPEAFEEVVCDSCESFLRDSKLMDKLVDLAKQDLSLFEKCKDYIDGLLDTLRKSYAGLTPDSREANEVLKMVDAIDELHRLWEEAALSARENYLAGNKQKNTTDEGDVKLQTRIVNGNETVWIEQNILKENNGLPVHQFIANFIAEHIGDVYTIIESGQKVYIGEDLPSEYTQSQYTQKILKNNPNIVKVKNRASVNLGEMIEIATNRRWEKTKHGNNKDAKYGMYRYDTRFGFPVMNSKKEVVGANIFTAELVIRNASDGKKYLYDIVSIKKDIASSDWLTDKTTSATVKTVGQKNNVSNDSISNSSKNVKENPVVAQKNTTSEGDVKFALREYSQHQKDNWKNSKRIVIYESETQFRDFINEALQNKQFDKKLYFGAIPTDLAALIKSKTGLDVEGFNCSLSAYEIRKLFDDHGDETKEALRGQRAITEDDIVNIPLVLQSPETIVRSKKDYMGKPVINMTKHINGKMTIAAVVSDKHLDLFVQTAYVGIKKGNLVTPIAEQAAINTPKASSDTVSNNIITNPTENVKKNSVKRSDRDLSYFDAVNNNDLERAQKLVLEAARKSGYDSPLLYHGTRSFGFTNFDLDKLDDGRSIFLTSSEKIASTYSGISGTRMIQKANNKNFSELSASELVDELNAYEEEVKGKTQESYEYELYDSDKLNGLIKSVNNGIDSLAETVGQKIEAYADKLAVDFNEDDYKVHSQLVKLSESLKGYDYNNLSTPIYMLLHNTDVFEGSEKVANLEKNIRLMNQLRNADVSNGVIAAESMGGYWIDILSIEEARNELETKVKKGNYSLLAKLGKSLVIDGEGQLWKDIRNWSKAAYIKREDVQLERVDNEFRLVNKSTGAEIENGILSANSNSEKLSKDYLIDLMLDKANYSISILTENLHTTRDIAKWAKEKGYDSVTFKNIRDNGGQNSEVGFDETADIYVIFNPNDVKSADPVTYDDNGEIIPLSERFDSDDSDIRYSDRITADMSDEERADILQKRKIKDIPVVENIPEAIMQKLGNISSWDEINNLFGKNKNTLIQKLASEFGVFKSYENEDVELSFSFSNNNYRESYHKQKSNYEQFAKMFSVFDDVIKNAVGIEIHKREGYKPDVTLKNVYVLISAFEDGDYIVPIKLEVKEFKDKQNTLYVAISLQAIKKTEVSKQGTTKNGVAQNSRSVNISVADLIRNVNPSDTSFTKYFPKKLLTEEQLRELTSNDGAEYSNKIGESNESFQDRASIDMSPRGILAGALESSIDAKTPSGQIQLKKLREYKEHIEQLNELSKKLSEQRKEIHSILSVKGGRTAETQKRLVYLQGKVVKNNNRVNILDKKLLNLEVTAPLKAVLETEKRKAAKRQKAKDNELMARVRERDSAKFDSEIKRQQEIRREQTEKRHKTEVRNRIKKVVGDLRSLLGKGTRERNVKIGLQDTVSKALSTAEILFSEEISNADIVRLGVESVTPKEQELLEKYSELLDLLDEKTSNAEEDSEVEKIKVKISRLNSQLKDVFVRERAKLNKEKVGDALNSLAAAYMELQNSEDEYIKENAFVQGMYDRIINLASDLKGITIKDMNLNQLTDVYKVYSMVKHMVTNANAIFREGRREDLKQMVSLVQGELDKTSSSGKDKTVGFEKVFDFVSSFSWNELKPYYAFDRLGSETFKKLFWDIIEADNVWAKDIEEAGKVIEDARKRYGYKKWDTKAVKTFKSANGLEFKLTLSDMMSIYAYSKRPQAEGHMTVGGFVFDKGNVYKEKKKGAAKTYKHATISETYRVDLTLINQIMEEFSKVEGAKEYVDEIQSYLTKLGEKGNEVSRIMFGIDLFKEKVYFPLKSATDYRSSVEQALNATPTMASLKNTGVSKETVPHATNPIVLQAFDDVVLEHINTMAKYHAYVIPIENLSKVFNNVGKDAINGEYVSTQALISSKFGHNATKYFNQLITDLNGGAFGGGAENPLAKFFGTAKAVSVSANLSVVVQQYFAIVRAMDEINPKYFTPFLNGEAVKTEERQWEEIKKYAPIAIIKEIGGIDMGANRSAIDYIGDAETKLDADKVKGKVKEYSMWLAGKMDEVGWSTIWRAVKKEISDTTNLVPGTKEFFEACGKRFTEVIVKTQVYDSVSSRSGYMRSKHESVKYLTSFMGEPTTIVNMMFSRQVSLARAIKAKDSKAIKEASKKLARTSGVIILSTVLTSLAKSLPYAMRDDEEEEDALLERWAKHFGESLKEEMNPLGLIPIGRDIVSVWEGWDVERPDMTLISDIITAFQKTIKDGCTLEEGMNLAGALANILGYPLKNVIRDAKGIIRLFGDFFDDNSPDDMGGAFAQGFSGKSDKEFLLSRFKRTRDSAMVKRETESMIARKIEEGKTEKESKASVRSSFTTTYKAHYVEAFKKGNIDEANRIRQFLYASGLYGSLSELDEILKNWRTEKN